MTGLSPGQSELIKWLEVIDKQLLFIQLYMVIVVRKAESNDLLCKWLPDRYILKHEVRSDAIEHMRHTFIMSSTNVINLLRIQRLWVVLDLVLMRCMRNSSVPRMVLPPIISARASICAWKML
jgi:hypothetical protein